MLAVWNLHLLDHKTSQNINHEQEKHLVTMQGALLACPAFLLAQGEASRHWVMELYPQAGKSLLESKYGFFNQSVI